MHESLRPEESRDEYSLDLLGGTEPTTRGDEVASPSEIQDDVTRPELGFLRSRPHPTRRRHRPVATGNPIPSSIVAVRSPSLAFEPTLPAGQVAEVVLACNVLN